MPNIYTTARRVVIWLGPGHDESDRAMEFIHDSKAHKFDRQWFLQTIFSAEGSDDLNYALCKVFLREYWGRLWVVQEVACAADAWVYCGKYSIAYTTLLEFQKTHEKAWDEAIDLKLEILNRDHLSISRQRASIQYYSHFICSSLFVQLKSFISDCKIKSH